MCESVVQNDGSSGPEQDGDDDQAVTGGMAPEAEGLAARGSAACHRTKEWWCSLHSKKGGRPLRPSSTEWCTAALATVCVRQMAPYSSRLQAYARHEPRSRERVVGCWMVARGGRGGVVRLRRRESPDVSNDT